MEYRSNKKEAYSDSDSNAANSDSDAAKDSDELTNQKARRWDRTKIPTDFSDDDDGPPPMMEYRSNKKEADSDSDHTHLDESTNHKEAEVSLKARKWDRTKFSTNRKQEGDDMGFARSQSERATAAAAGGANNKRSAAGGVDGDSWRSVAMATGVVSSSTSGGGDEANGGHVIKKRKVNSIWADVIAEQQLTQRISSTSNFTMKDRRRATLVRRGPESYDRKRPLSPDGDGESRDRPASVTMETETSKNSHATGGDNPFSLDKKNSKAKFDRNDKIKRCDSDQSLNSENGRKNFRDKNRSKFDKNRLGNRSGNFKFTPKPMKFDVEFDKNQENSEEFVKRLVFALSEPKFHLIDRCVKNLGVEKSIDFFNQTKSIELAGGRMTLDKSRRRSPGGVFLELIRSDPTVDDEVKAKIFEQD